MIQATDEAGVVGSTARHDWWVRIDEVRDRIQQPHEDSMKGAVSAFIALRHRRFTKTKQSP